MNGFGTFQNRIWNFKTPRSLTGARMVRPARCGVVQVPRYAVPTSGCTVTVDAQMVVVVEVVAGPSVAAVLVAGTRVWQSGTWEVRVAL